MPIPNLQPEPFRLPIIINTKHDKPYIELRAGTSNPELLKAIISAAFHKQPVIVQPCFTDELKSIGSMIEKGILYRDGEQYFFTF